MRYYDSNHSNVHKFVVSKEFKNDKTEHYQFPLVLILNA